MQRFLLTLPLTLPLVATALAAQQTIVSPVQSATTEGSASNVFPFSSTTRHYGLPTQFTY